MLVNPVKGVYEHVPSLEQEARMHSVSTHLLVSWHCSVVGLQKLILQGSVGAVQLILLTSCEQKVLGALGRP